MSESSEGEPLVVIADITEWINSSLCSCAISLTSVGDEHRSEETEQNIVGKTTQVESTILEKALANGKLFRWIVHSFKPDLVSAPPLEQESNDDEQSELDRAFKIAQEDLGVQNLLLPSDLPANEKGKSVDSLILLTYFARFRCAVGNIQPACHNWPSKTKISWRLNVDNNALQLRPSSDSPKCVECSETVLILDRLLLPSTAGNAACHRRCFRCERCQKLLRIGLYRPAKSGIGYECLEHEKEDLARHLTPAPEPKSGSVEQATETAEENAPVAEEEKKIYPDLPAPQKDVSYPQLAEPTETVDQSAAAKSSADVAKPVKQTTSQLSPPVSNRSRSSERDIPVPAPRHSKHIRGGSDAAVSTPSMETSQPSQPAGTSPKPDRPSRPSIPPKRAPGDSVTLRRDYPDDLNPFGDADPPPVYRHSTVPTLTMEHSKTDQRRSLAVPSVKPTGNNEVTTTIKEGKEGNYDDSLNPFGSDLESDGEENQGGGSDGDTSSLSSTNPFNESDEDDATGHGKESKKAPPPRPPPPSRTAASASTVAKETHKKRPAPPPPSSKSGGSVPPPRPSSPKKQGRKKRPAPPRPLPLKRQIRTESELSPETLTTAFNETEDALVRTEAAGATFETGLREGVDERGYAKVSNEQINEWITLVRQKFDLVRKETELVYVCRERQLDELHAEVEYQLRCMIEKPESEKTPDDMEREAALLQRMLDVIEEKSKLIDTQDELRAQTGTLPTNAIHLDDSSLSGGGSKGSTLEGKGAGTEMKQGKKKKKIKLRLKKLKQKIATSMLSNPWPVVPM